MLFCSRCPPLSFLEHLTIKTIYYETNYKKIPLIIPIINNNYNELFILIK
ncbi:unnamed protein product, partial [Brassica napus]